MDHISFYGLQLNLTDVEARHAHVTSYVDPDEFDLAHEYLEPGDRCLVAGGGLGSVFIWAVARLGIENVVAFEPIQEHVEFFVRNVRYNHKTPTFLWGALGTADGDAALYRTPIWTGSTLIPSDSEDVKPITVPQFDTRKIIEKFRINALVLDVEGWEHEIIPHIDLTPLRCITMEMHGSREKASILKKDIIEAGFDIVHYIDHYPAPLQHIGAVR